jgi:hypothetical protein
LRRDITANQSADRGLNQFNGDISRVKDREESAEDKFSKERLEPFEKRYNSALIYSIKMRRNQWFQDQGGGYIKGIGENQSSHPCTISKSLNCTTHHRNLSMSNMAKQAALDTAAIEAVVTPGTQGANTAAESSSNPHRRTGKELVEQLGTDVEKKAMVVNMANTRGAARVWLMAVGIFLSMLTVTSKYLVESMKKVWKTRGLVEMSPLEGRRFVLEFTEEGDFNHVTRGGPWRYRDDAVLIEALKEGEDPELVVFTTVPIWVQFKEIPFHLLSKELARDLGKRVGELMSIDNNSRSDMFSKILKARVRLPLDTPLLRWIVLLDGITKEEVVVSIGYERLPSFCCHCGIVGHQGARCPMPEELKTNGYKPELGVPPTHFKDPRRWYLAASTGQTRRILRQDLPWGPPL